jgi:hypothetical protein
LDRRRLVRSLLERTIIDKDFGEKVSYARNARVKCDQVFAATIKAAAEFLEKDEEENETDKMQNRETVATLLALIDEYEAFMLVRRAAPLPLGPTYLVDAVWHAHILDTRAYAAFCNATFGRFEHHDPGLNDGQYENTLHRFRETGTPHAEVWWSDNEVNEVVWGDPDSDTHILHAFTTDFMVGVGCG